MKNETMAIILSTIITAMLLCLALLLIKWMLDTGQIVTSKQTGYPGTLDILVSCIVSVATIVGCQHSVMNLIYQPDTKKSK